MSLTKHEGLWVWAFDIHAPKIHRPTLKALLQFVERNKLVGFGFGGDQFDNEEISHHNKKKIIFRSPGAYQRNTDYFEREVLTPIEERLGRDTARVWISGNHDDWENQLVQEQPELLNTIERPKLLRLAERGWEFVPTGGIYKLGKLSVIHGETLSGLGNQASIYHAKRAIEAYGRSVLYGHIHSPQSFARIAPYSQTDKHMAWCSPIIGITNPTYLRNRPTAWINGFTIVEVHKDGSFQVYPVVVTNGKFRYGGEVYG